MFRKNREERKQKSALVVQKGLYDLSVSIRNQESIEKATKQQEHTRHHEWSSIQTEEDNHYACFRSHQPISAQKEHTITAGVYRYLTVTSSMICTLHSNKPSLKLSTSENKEIFVLPIRAKYVSSRDHKCTKTYRSEKGTHSTGSGRATMAISGVC